MNRRMALAAARVACVFWTAFLVYGASNFWDTKAPAEWSADELTRLKTNSPWARKVALEIKGRNPAAAMDSNGTPGSFGGMRGADSNGISVTGRGRGGSSGGSQPNSTREVVIRWESAKPMLNATGWTPPDAFQNSYAISVTGLPSAVVIMAVAADPAGAGDDPAARQKAAIQRLLAGTTLTVKGRDPQAAEFVVQSPDRASLIFGFGKSASKISAEDREVVFQMQLGPVTIHAKFEPKAMTVNGQPSL